MVKEGETDLSVWYQIGESIYDKRRTACKTIRRNYPIGLIVKNIFIQKRDFLKAFRFFIARK